MLDSMLFICRRHRLNTFLLLLESLITSGVIIFLMTTSHGDIRICDEYQTSSSTRNMLSSQQHDMELPRSSLNESHDVVKDGMYMIHCPLGWKLKILRRNNIDTTPSQRCQRDDGNDGWICARGWERVDKHPFCRRMVNQRESGLAPIGPEFSQVSDELKLVFIHVPQAGGVTMERSFLFDDQREKLDGHYLGGHHGITSFNRERTQEYHKFCVVRHPCSRLYSVWKYLAQRNGNELDDMWVDEHFDDSASSSFNVFIEKTLQPEGNVDIEMETHLKSQVGMLFHDNDDFGLDQILVFERWNESVENLGRRIMLDTSQLKSTYKDLGDEVNCKEVYTDKAWAKMTILYAMDLCVLGYSKDINHERETPVLDWTPEIFTSRYKSCKEHTSSKATPNVTLNFVLYNKSLNSNPKCTVYTYFHNIPGKSKKETRENMATLQVWTESWSSAGWIPRVLSEEDAKAHPDYRKLRDQFMVLPTINTKAYEMACFMRYVAMAAAGGGWMTDYDVLPIRLPKCTPPFNNGRLTVHERFVPALVSGTKEEYTRIATEMASIDWQGNRDIFDHNGVPHVSDMLCLLLLAENRRVESEWTVNSAYEIFQSPFHCNNSRVHPEYRVRLIDNGMSPLPVAIHYSHAAVEMIRHSDSVLNLRSNDDMSLQKFKTSRAAVMKVGHDFFYEKCYA